MKVRITFNIGKRVLDKILDEMGSKELKDRIKNALSVKFAPLNEYQVKITNLKLEVSE